MDWDLQLILLAVAIILLLLTALGAFYKFGMRETSFEQYYSPGIFDNKTNRKEKAKQKPAKSKKKSKDVQKITDDVEEPEMDATQGEEEEPLLEKEEIQMIASPQVPPMEEPRKPEKKHKKSKKTHYEETEQKAWDGLVDVEEEPIREVEATQSEVHPQDPPAAEPNELDTQMNGGVPGKKGKKKPKGAKSQVESVQEAAQMEEGPPQIATEPDVDLILDQLRKRNSLTEVQLSFVLETILTSTNLKSEQSKDLENLKKELVEKERLLTQESQLVQSSNNRSKQFRQELESEREKSQAFEKTFREQLAGKSAEIERLNRQVAEMNQAVAQRTKSLQDQILQYRQHLEQANPQQTEQLRVEVQRQKELVLRGEQEHRRFEGEIQRLNAELHARMDYIRKVEKEKVAQQQKMQTAPPPPPPKVDESADQKLAELQMELKEKEQESESVKVAMQSIQKDLEGLDETVTGLRTAKDSLQGQVKELTLRNDSVTQDLRKKEDELLSVQKQLESKPKDDKICQELKTVMADLGEVRAANERLFAQLGVANAKKSELEGVLESLKAEREVCVQQEEAPVHMSLEHTLAIEKDMEDKLEKVFQLEQRVVGLTSQLEEVTKNASETSTRWESELQSLEGEKAKETEELAQRLADAEQRRDELADRAEALASELASVKQGKGSSREQLAGEVSELRVALQTAEFNLRNREIELKNLRAEFDNRKRDNDDLAAKLEKAEREKLRTGAVQSRELEKQRQELDEQADQNNNLREKNDKLVQMVQTAEENAVKAVKDAQNRCEKEAAGKVEEVWAMLRKALPNTASPKKTPETYREWLHEIEQVVKKEVVEKHTHSETTIVKEAPLTTSPALEMENQELRAACEQYRQVLGQVAGDMSELEQRAAEEQESTLRRCADLEQRLEAETAPPAPVPEASDVQLVEDNEKLRAELESLRAAMEQVAVELCGMERMASMERGQWLDRCRQLELRLLQAESPKDSREFSTEEVRTQLSELQLKLSTEAKERDVLRTEIQTMRVDLEKERETGRDLSAQAVKLRGMLKTGQDALRQEQELVAQLQSQLKAYQNGLGERGLHEDLQQLKVRLSEREEQLEREVAINKQLGNKLASLGLPIND